MNIGVADCCNAPKSEQSNFRANLTCQFHIVSCGVQFGKVDATTYIMDYNPAEITAIQAFAISLSTFDTKLLL